MSMATPCLHLKILLPDFSSALLLFLCAQIIFSTFFFIFLFACLCTGHIVVPVDVVRDFHCFEMFLILVCICAIFVCLASDHFE